MRQWMVWGPIGGIVFLILSLTGAASPIDETDSGDTTMLSLPVAAEGIQSAESNRDTGDKAGGKKESGENQMLTVTTEKSNLTPDQALKLLAAGNAKMLGEASEAADQVPTLSTDADRFPSATVFYATGSSVPTELLGLDAGDLYQVPLRGGVFTADEMDDLEYGIVNLRTPVAVVLTDYPNRDVLYVVNNYDDLKSKAEAELAKAKAEGGPEENTVPTSDDTYLYTLLGPAVARAKSAYPDKSNEELASLVSETVAWQSLESILNQSDAVVQLVKSGDLKLVAAMTDDSDGRIYWLGEHPLQSEFIKDMPEEVKEKRQKAQEQANTENKARAENKNSTENKDNKETTFAVTEEEVTEPLTQEQVETVITEYQPCREELVAPCNACYVNPPVYVPSWQLFYPAVWYYRPWYGYGVYAYVPWPYYDPWYYGYVPYVPVYRRVNWGFFFGVGIGIGIGLHIDHAYHPWDPYWDRPIFRDPIHHPGWHPGDPHDILWHGPHHPGPGPGVPRPGGPHPGPAGPGGPRPGHGPDGPHHPGHGPGDWHPGAMRPDGGKVPGREGIEPHPGKGATDHPDGAPSGTGNRPGVGEKPSRDTDRSGITGRPGGKEGAGPSGRRGAEQRDGGPRKGGRPGSGETGAHQGIRSAAGDAAGREGDRPSTGAAGREGDRPSTGTAGREGDRPSTGAAGREGDRPSTGSAGREGMRPSTGAAGREGMRPSTGSAGREGMRPSTGSAEREGIRPSTGAAGREGMRPSTGAAGREGMRPGTGAAGREGMRPSTGSAGRGGTRPSAGLSLDHSIGTGRGVGAGPEGTGLREARSGSAGIGIREGARPGTTGIGIKEGARPGTMGIGIREGARPGVSEMRGIGTGGPRPAGSGFSGPRPGMGGIGGPRH